MMGNRRWQIFEMSLASGLAIFAAVTLFIIIPMEILPPRTRFGAAANAASPAMMPNIVAGLILVFALLYLYRSYGRFRQSRAEGGEGGSALQAIGWRTPVIIVLATIYALTFESIPFVIGTPLFVIATYYALETYPIRFSPVPTLSLVGGAVAFSFAIKMVFERGFQIYLGG